MVRSEANGRELIAAFRGPGWLVGATGVILGGAAELTAQCACECDVLPVGAETFRTLLVSDQATAAWVQRMLAREIRQQARQIGQFVLDPESRLRWILSELASPAPDSDRHATTRLAIPITQHDLADAIGASRELVSRLLGRLEKVGVIERKKGWILVSDRVLLSQS